MKWHLMGKLLLQYSHAEIYKDDRTGFQMAKPRKTFTKTVHAVSLILLVILAACRSAPLVPTAPGTTGSITRSSFQPTTDIPIPNGARFDADASLVLSSRDYWTGRLVLDADQSISQIFAFYQQQMPQLNWKSVASVLSTTSVLTFIRKNRTATVQITPKNWGGAEISITVAIRDPDATGGVKTSPLPIPESSNLKFDPPSKPVSPTQSSTPTPPSSAADAPKFQQQIPKVY